MESSVIVVTGGDPVDPSMVADLAPAALVVAADSGLEQADHLGLAVDIAVGDFDSLSPDRLAEAEADGCRIERHPAAKDQTDLELALLVVLARGAERVVVVGGAGGRLDHLLANALVIAAPAFADLAVEARMGRAWLYVARPAKPVTFAATVGEMVTLLATGGTARQVRTRGLGYPLVDEDLLSGSTRGVSNVVVDTSVGVSLGRGALVVIRPDATQPEQPMS